MADDDRLLNTLTNQNAVRRLADGCSACGFSEVYCRCVIYLDRGPCCEACDHGTPPRPLVSP